MCDAFGMAQIVKAIADMTKGDAAPSVLPAWNRELLQARDPPCVTCEHHEFDEVSRYVSVLVPLYDMCHRYFMFGASEISAIQRSLPQLQGSSTFEVITAFLWCCHAAALGLNLDDEVRAIITVNSCNKLKPPLPRGHYGNVITTPVAVARAGELCSKPLGFALKLIRKIKAGVTDEYLRSFVDHIVSKGRPVLTLERTFLCSDITRLRFGEVDFGWGKPKYGGPAAANMSYYIAYKNKDGENDRRPHWLPVHGQHGSVRERGPP